MKNEFNSTLATLHEKYFYNLKNKEMTKVKNL